MTTLGVFPNFVTFRSLLGAPSPCHPVAYSLCSRAVIHTRIASTSDHSGNELPSCDGDVVRWAQNQFRSEVIDGSSDGNPRQAINLVKASMFIALEEAAAAAAAAPEELNGGREVKRAVKFPSLAELAASLSGSGGNKNNMENILGGVGAASTWNLKRLEALSMDAAAEFYRLCSEAGAVDGIQTVVEAGADDSALLTVFSDLVATFPTNLISAINTTLFERQGYRRSRKHGDPRDASLGAVLESGQGSPGALALLYMAVAELCELSLHACPLDDGRYFVLWPVDQRILLGAGGERFVIDPYAQGSLVSEGEIAEMFGEDIPLKAATSVEIIAAGLAPLRDAHWSRALGCPPEPAFMVPISVDLALGQYNQVSVSYRTEGNEEEKRKKKAAGREEQQQKEQQWWPRKGYSLERALAAAEKRRWLLPHDIEAAVHLGVLLFFSGVCDQACIELSAAVEMAERGENKADAEKVKVLWQKARLMAEFNKSAEDESQSA